MRPCLLRSHLRVLEKVLDVGGPEHLLVVHPYLGRPVLDQGLGRFGNLGGDSSYITESKATSWIGTRGDIYGMYCSIVPIEVSDIIKWKPATAKIQGDIVALWLASRFRLSVGCKLNGHACVARVKYVKQRNCWDWEIGGEISIVLYFIASE